MTILTYTSPTSMKSVFLPASCLLFLSSRVLIHTQTYIYIHKYVYTYTCIYLQTYIHTCIYIFTDLYTYMYTYICPRRTEGGQETGGDWRRLRME
jgi:hypothetical protein